MPQRNHPVALLLAALAFARMVFTRLPLPVVLLGLAPVSITITAFGGQEDTVNTSPSSLIVAAHLALLSSISYGGSLTVLPDVNDLAAANRWVTDRESANSFAVSQIVPGSNMILMMSFVGLKVGSIGADRECTRHLRPAARTLLCLISIMGQFSR